MTRKAMRTAPAWRALALAAAFWRLSAWAAEPLAVISELRLGAGDVKVLRAGESSWIPAQPLVTLRPGDQVRTTGEAQAVVLFSGGGVQKVSAGNSPLVIQSPKSRSGAESAQGLLGGVVQFLMGQQRDPRYEQLSVRGPSLAPRIVSPRDTRLFPGPVTFEWTGSASLRYGIKISGPDGVVWEADNLPRQPQTYPASAPPLRPGSRYTWTLTAPGQPAQQTQFEIVSAPEAHRITGAIAQLRSDTLAGYPPSTIVVARAGLLLQERLYADARREILAGLAADPAAATLRQLLGLVYERSGLGDLAVQEYEEATMLSTPRS
jgi:hypothetical protein